MRISGVGIEQLVQLAHAVVELDVRSGNAFRPFCFGLVGTLGAGKTRLCQEIAQAWGIDSTEVTSPTFTLLKSYAIASRGDPPTTARQLHHLDLYRVGDEDELWELGLDELWEAPGTWTLVEWADRFADCMPADMIWIRIEVADDSIAGNLSHGGDAAPQPLRTIELHSTDPLRQAWLQDLGSRLGEIGFSGTFERC